MSLTWLAALLVAVAHHVYNASLNGQRTTGLDPERGPIRVLQFDQTESSTFGTAFAFLVSSFLGINAATAFIQCAWWVVQRRSFSLGGLDALWSSTTDPLTFLSFDFWKTARGVVMIAAISWAFPLIITFAPGTLSVESCVQNFPEPCNVPTFDFGQSTSRGYGETTSLDPSDLVYLRPSALAYRVAGATLLGGQPFSPASPCAGNCSYLISVDAPAFSCTPGFPSTSNLTWVRSSGSAGTAWAAKAFDITPPKYKYTNWDVLVHYADVGNLVILSDGANITCVAYNSTYDLSYTFSGSVSSISVERIVLDQPGNQLMLGTFADRRAAGSVSNDPDFDDVDHRGNGTFVYTAETTNGPGTMAASQSHLAGFAQGSNITWADVPTMMESLLQNLTLSLLTVDPSQTTLVTCQISDTHTYFSYNERRLWLVYGLGLGCALLADLVGVFALVRNQFGATAGFTDFLAATRNTELNELDFTGAKQKQRIRLRYGPLRDATGRYAFAFPESICVPTEGAERRASAVSTTTADQGESHQMKPLMYLSHAE
ncbi:hypothetical protein B0H13DRAFT_1878693 [Mycena leptocephala]|nr:hypothetical protein B0H13DRAFT_1878693 [Mycena leptocephala]